MFGAFILNLIYNSLSYIYEIVIKCISSYLFV